MNFWWKTSLLSPHLCLIRADVFLAWWHGWSICFGIQDRKNWCARYVLPWGCHHDDDGYFLAESFGFCFCSCFYWWNYILTCTFFHTPFYSILQIFWTLSWRSFCGLDNLLFIRFRFPMWNTSYHPWSLTSVHHQIQILMYFSRQNNNFHHALFSLVF